MSVAEQYSEFSITLFTRKGRLHASTPIHLRDVMRDLTGRKWDPESRTWHVPATGVAARELWEHLQPYLTDETISIEDGAAKLLAEAEGLRKAEAFKTADLDELADLPGKTSAWLHQRRAFHFAAARKATMLAMDMGTGKSRTAIGLLDQWDTNTAVILCPRSVAQVWPNQFELHSGRTWDVLVPSTKMTVRKRSIDVMKGMDLAAARKRPFVVVVNYEAFWRDPMISMLFAVLAQGDVGVLVLDEIHRIKAPGGRASINAAKLGSVADMRLGLTGTPMPHSPMDLYAQFRALDNSVFGTSYNRFKNRYAVMGGYEGHQVLGYQKELELAKKFGQHSFVVKKEDAGLDLPPTRHEPEVMEGGRLSGPTVFELESKSARAYEVVDQEFILGVEDGTVTIANALVKLLRLQQITSGYVRDDDGVDHQIGTEKIDALEDLLEGLAPPKWSGKPFVSSLVEPGEPVVIFARFHPDIERIKELCEKQGRRVGIVDGHHKLGKEGFGLNDKSQMRDDIDVCILQIQSGGVGIDLTRACYAIYYSLDFSLGNFEQSLARVHRPGQQRHTFYYHLIAKGTKDEVVYRALRDRKKVVEAVIAASQGKPAEEWPDEDDSTDPFGADELWGDAA